MRRTTITALRMVLVAFLGVLLLTQVWVLPTLAAEMAATHPEVAHLRVPVLTAAIATVVCLQVAVGSVLALLSRVEEERIFDQGSRRPVDVFIAAVVVATLVVTLVNGYLTLVLGQNTPGVVLGLGAMTVAGTGVALLMVVMKALLQQATRQRAELAGVV